jgi:sugar lactone lactonase YvrE
MFRRLFSWLAIAVIVIAAVLFVRYGGGQPYADLNTQPLLPEQGLEIAAQYNEPIGNIAVTTDGRLFFTVHPESRPERVKLLEWKDGKAVPWPREDAQGLFDTPLGLAIDNQRRLWVIDHGMHGVRKPRLWAFDLATGNSLVRYEFNSDVAPIGSFLQDVRVAPDGNTVYIADVSFWRKRPGIVVYDVASNTARRVLTGHESVMPQDWLIGNPIKTMDFFRLPYADELSQLIGIRLPGLVALKPGVDGLTVTADGKWLYFAAMAHDTLYRIETQHLKKPGLNDEQLAPLVQAVGKKPLNDGLSSDMQGNVLLTDVEHSSIVRWRADSKQLQTLVRSPRIRWADGLSHGPDGWLYLADSAIPEQMLQTKAHIASRAPYIVWRIKTDVPGQPGQ